MVAPIVSRTDASMANGRLLNSVAKMSPTVDSATQPSPRLASVTPSWLAERMREIFEEARSAKRASRSPLLVIASRRARLERTRANSAPTKNAFRSTSRIMASSRPSTDTSYHNSGDGHQHGSEHRHGVGHSHVRDAPVSSLRIALVLTALLLVVEAIGGLLSNSIALLADAGHMLTDVAALGLALFVAWFSKQPETPQKTYGYLRWEILAAFVNGGTLLLISAWILWTAVMRLRSPEQVASGLMLSVAAVGLMVNIIAARVLVSSSARSLNARGAYLHIVGDLLATVGTLAAAVAIRYTGWLIADPIASILTTVLIMNGAWRLVRESVDILLESTPAHIPLPAVRGQLEAIPGIESVHDLHVWAVTPAVVAMSAHCIVRQSDQHQHVLEHIHDAMRLFGIQHVTIQLERDDMLDRERHLHA